MAEFIRPEEKVVNVSEPVIFENNTDSDFSVSAAIVFRKSGLYDVSIVGRRTIVSKVAERRHKDMKADERFSPKPINPIALCCKTEDDYLIKVIRTSLSYSGIKGDDIPSMTLEILKKLGRYDLIPPCER